MPDWLIGALVAVVVAGIPGWQAGRTNRRVRRMEAEQRDRDKQEAQRQQNEVDRAKAEEQRIHTFEAAQRAANEMLATVQRVNNEIVDGLREEIARLRSELDRLREREASVVDRLQSYQIMELSVTRMRNLVELYRTKLEEAGIVLDDDGQPASP